MAIQKYLDKAVAVLEKYGLLPQEGEEDSQLASLLQEVVAVDEPKVLAIAKTLRYTSKFNDMVRENVEDIRIGDRYGDITKMFDSIRDDAKTLLKQLEDGKIDWKEKLQNLWMKFWRGTPHKRFEKIRELYLDVSEDTKGQLDNENEIMEGYMDFRFALKDAEILAQEVLKTQEANLENVRQELQQKNEAFSSYKGDDEAEKSRLQMARDEAQRAFNQEDKNYQLIKDVAENFTIGYNVGETLVAKLKQTHDVKEQVHRRAMVFFGTNEHVFTLLDAVYTSQHGLHEATQTYEAMKEGINKGIEDVAELGRELEKAALKAGYGSTLSKESVQKLVDAVVSYQEESLQTIKQLREESAQNAKEIAEIVEQGKEKCQQIILGYVKIE